jgi:hypothetical protein
MVFYAEGMTLMKVIFLYKINIHIIKLYKKNNLVRAIMLLRISY